jgi:type II secretory pathway component GspD/PulD (secretin)
VATRTDEVEAALVTALKAALISVTKDVAALTYEDVDADTDNIVVTAPAVRIQFQKEALQNMGDRNFLDYESDQKWIALVGASRPSTVEIERGAAQNILELAKDALAGLRLTLASNPQGNAVVMLGDPELFNQQQDGTWYALPFTVKSFSSFTANIGSIR